MVNKKLYDIEVNQIENKLRKGLKKKFGEMKRHMIELEEAKEDETQFDLLNTNLR